MLALAGCGVSAPFGGDGPAGNVGRLELTAVSEPQMLEAYPNLIPNGDFGTWWAGAPAPEHFQRPDRELSAVRRVGGIGNSPFAALQDWRGADMRTGVHRQFGVMAAVEGGVRYTLSVMAERLPGGTPAISIWVWTFDAEGTADALDSPFMLLTPAQGLCKRYVRSFTPQKGGPVLITSRAEGSGRIVWHEWRLTRDPDQE